jgi:hypothetical protein
MSDARAAWVTLAAALLPVAVVSLWAWVHPVKLVAAGVLAICMLLGVVP